MHLLGVLLGVVTGKQPSIGMAHKCKFVKLQILDALIDGIDEERDVVFLGASLGGGSGGLAHAQVVNCIDIVALGEVFEHSVVGG